MQDTSEVDAATLRNQPTFASLTFDAPCKHAEYASADARRRSFLAAAAQLPGGQNIDDLVDAGFFHVGKSHSCHILFIALKLEVHSLEGGILPRSQVHN